MRFTRKDLASKLGFKNLGRGIWLIDQIERGENDERLIPRICELLEITELDLKRCQNEEDRLIREYRASLPPFTPHIVRRFAACVYVKILIPDHIKPSDLLNYATNLARELKSELCVRLNYDLCYWVRIDGTCKKDTNPATHPKSVISFAGEQK